MNIKKLFILSSMIFSLSLLAQRTENVELKTYKSEKIKVGKLAKEMHPQAAKNAYATQLHNDMSELKRFEESAKFAPGYQSKLKYLNRIYSQLHMSQTFEEFQQWLNDKVKELEEFEQVQ